MQSKLFKIGLILCLVIGITGCAETVYLTPDNGIESIKVISVFWYYIRWSLCVISALIALLFVGEYFRQYDATLWLGTLIFIFIGILFYVGTLNPLALISGSENLSPLVKAVTRSKFKTDPQFQEYWQRQQFEADRYDLKVQIGKAQTSIASLKQDRSQKVLPLKQNYSQMYDQYYPQLAQQLPETGIRSHEELLKNCEQYLELCSSLNRVAKLQYYINKLDDKLKQIGANIIKLDDNVWNMERTFELSQIFSDEELESVEQLIEETKGKIDSQVPPPEKQDVAGLEEQIFNDILRS